MNNQKPLFRKHRATPAEVLLKQKHDSTKLLAEQMMQQNTSQADLERKLAERRRLARLQMMQEMAPQKQQSNDDEKTKSMISQSANSGGNIHNNINVAINYVVQEKSQKVEAGSRRKKGRKVGKRKSQDRISEKDLMNSSLSKMLDQELLMGNASIAATKTPVNDYTRASNSKSDSLTHDIFHGDKIYLKGGNMAFKPLGMETVLEQNEEAHTTAKAGWNKAKRSQIRTTENNIAFQQQLDDATAQELVSFPQQLGRKESEEQSEQASKIGGGQQQKSSLRQVKLKEKKGLFPSKSVKKDISTILKNNSQFSNKAAGDSRIQFQTLDQPSTKHRTVENDRQLHRGLQQMSRKLRNSQANISRGSSVNRMKDSFEDDEEQQVAVQISENIGLVRDSSGESLHPSQISGSNTIEPTAHQLKSQAKIADIIGQKLHRQGTNNTKVVSRKLRDMKYDNENQEELEEDEDQLKTQTVMQSDYAMPTRMHQNRTFQPLKANLMEITQRTGNSSELVQEDNNLSRLAKDFKMHQENQVRIQNLMALIGNTAKGVAAGNQIGQIDDKISDVVSLGAFDDYQYKESNTKLPVIGNIRVQEGLEAGDSDHQATSTAFGTQVQAGSSKNARKTSEKAYESAIEANSRGANSSMLLRQSSQDKFEIKRNTDTMIPTSSKSIVNMRAGKSSISIPSQHNHQKTDYKLLQPNYQDQNLIQRKNHAQNVGSEFLTAQGSKQKLQKHKIVRSSLFNNNPMLENKNSMLFSENNDSEYSIGHKSLFVKNGNEFGIKAEECTIDDNLKSPRSLYHLRSVSHRRLQPLASNTSRKYYDSKDKRSTQSINFNKGLTFVLVKGKFQPSEKYISKNMMPYTNTQFNSVVLKSTNQRQTLNIKPVVDRQIPMTKSKAKSRKIRGSKMRRPDQMKAQALAYQTHQQASRKKGIIEEDVESESRDKIGEGSMERDDNMTWQDVMDENSALKDQIMNQIAIFEQYLKVAVLQKKAQQREEEAWHREQGLKRNHSVDEHMFRSERDFEFDDNRESNAYKLQQSAQRKTVKSKQPNVTMVGKKQAPYGDIHIEEYAMQSQHSKQTGFSRRKSSAKSSRSRHSRRSSRSPSPMSKHVGTIPHHYSMQHSKSKTKLGSGHKTYVSMSRKLSSKQYENLMLIKGESGPAELTHKTHQHWITKIEKLWLKLNQQRNSEVVRIQDEIKTNKMRIQQLTRDNLFELDVNFHDQKLFLKASYHSKKVKKAAKKSQETRKVQALEKRYREELDRKIDFDTWGFHNHIIEYRLKVRMTEDVIDCAQRVSIKSDQKTTRELTLLKFMRDRLYEDLRYFIAKRETKPWRNWDRSGFYYKPSLENRDLTLQQVNQRIDANLLMIAYLEPRYSQLIRDIPPYNVINSEMIQFCTEQFGNEGWLQLFQLRMLRKQQEDQQHEKQYMPPVDHIKKMEVDPYTLQVVKETVPAQAEQEEVQPDSEPSLEEKKEEMPVSWHIRKPEKANQAKLSTGYEKMINVRDERVREGSQDTEQGSASPDLTQSAKRHTSMPTTLSIRDIDDSEEGSLAQAQLAYKGISASEGLAHSYPRHTEGKTTGTAMHKFEGEDVVQHLKDMATLGEKQEMEDREADQVAKSNWLQILEREKKEKLQREVVERKERAARLAILFEDEDMLSQDDEDMLDAGAAKQHVSSYIDKIDTHLKVEKRLLEAWQEKDGAAVKEGPGEDPVAKNKK